MTEELPMFCVRCNKRVKPQYFERLFSYIGEPIAVLCSTCYVTYKTFLKRSAPKKF